MDYKEFNNRKNEIFCNICCVDLLADILNITDTLLSTVDNELECTTIEQLCELFSYVEQKKITKTKIQVLKFYRKINYIENKIGID